MKKIFISLMLLVFVNVVSGLELKKADDDLKTPELKLESLKGKPFDLKEYKDHVVLVQFWATYCTPCRKEMPSMNSLEKKLKELEVPFKILAINMGETKEEVQKFVDEVKPEFSILLDEKGENVQAWNVFAAPSNFVIDGKGKIRYTLFGEVEWDSDEIVDAIKALSTEKELEKSQ